MTEEDPRIADRIDHNAVDQFLASPHLRETLTDETPMEVTEAEWRSHCRRLRRKWTRAYLADGQGQEIGERHRRYPVETPD